MRNYKFSHDFARGTSVNGHAVKIYKSDDAVAFVHTYNDEERDTAYLSKSEYDILIDELWHCLTYNTAAALNAVLERYFNNPLGKE